MVLAKLNIHMQKNGTGPLKWPYIKINSKWVKNLKIISETKTTRWKQGKSFLTWVWAIILWLWHQCLGKKATRDEPKIFYTANEITNRVKRQPTEHEKIFVNHLSGKWLILKIYKKLIQLNRKKNPLIFKNEQRIFIDISPKKTRRGPTDTWRAA